MAKREGVLKLGFYPNRNRYPQSVAYCVHKEMQHATVVIRFATVSATMLQQERCWMNMMSMQNLKIKATYCATSLQQSQKKAVARPSKKKVDNMGYKTNGKLL